MDRIYQDIASGLNDQRKGLLRLIEDLPVIRPDYVICTYKDRIARFGTNLLETFCKIYKSELVEMRVQKQSEEDEFISSLMAILTSFMGKFYRKRRGKK